MVLLLSNSYTYDHDFNTASLAYLNRYPNPYAKHVLSSDTLECYIDNQGNLRTTRFVIKTGRLPGFIKPFLGDRLNSCIIEKLIINPNKKTMVCYSANIDHRKFIKIEELLNYATIKGSTFVDSNVKFSSNFIGFKQKIEEWSHSKFLQNMKNSRQGLGYVMNQFKNKSYQ